ncbi:MAG: glycogen debranching enzyme N-terminal domain-containing protein [Sedimentisphaerales bacterium]|nr:glycogen debranching enzyme N-terminal domain-containing protein [Sedimentisphaerales bacterium]
MNPVDNIISIDYKPDSNCNLLKYSILRINVRVKQNQEGASGPFRVMIRTNLNQGRRIRRQIIDLVEKGQSYSTDFYDIPTLYCPETNTYGVNILLNEVGFYEFKVRVESARKDRPWVKWADGPNVGISVSPLEYGRNNSLYCAFIRQYGKNKDKENLKNEEFENQINRLELQGACVLPPGGNFEQFEEMLPFIINELGMKIIHLLPINPVPTAYGRMGMYGSPYATTDYFGIDHTYGTFSRYYTIEDQFVDLTSTIHGLGAKVFLDMVINHTGWASSILFTHRHWIKVGQDRRIISPGAWGVTWGDLVELDYKHKDLWQYMAKVFLCWCRRGIDGFRLDAGYMVPLEVWRYIIAKVREEYPNTLFLLEGLGGPWSTTENLLTQGQTNWAYSELFQNYSRQQITDYLAYAQYVSAGKGVLVHYAETHDNERLAKKGKVYTLMRLRLCAFTSFAGAWGFTNGVEWLATEKIDVHRNTGLNWGAENNLVPEITRINKILAENPAFWGLNNLNIIETHNENVLSFIRSNNDRTNVIVCLINLNTEEAQKYSIQLRDLAGNQSQPEDMILNDLLSENQVEANPDTLYEGHLEAGGCILYRWESAREPLRPTVPAIYDVEYEQISLIYRILLNRFKPYEVGQIDQEKVLRQVTDFRKFIVLVNSVPLEYLIKHNIEEAILRIEDEIVDRYSAVWTFRESNKEFIISGDKWLIAHTFAPCTAYLKIAGRTLRIDSIPSHDKLGHLSFFPPQGDNETAMLTFNWKIERNQRIKRQMQDEEYPILSVPSGLRKPRIRKIYPLTLRKKQLLRDNAKILLTNGIGGVCQCPGRPGVIESKYDTLLAITCDNNNPGNRLALVKMLKETIQVGQKYFDLDESFLVSFTRYPQPLWEFVYDDGEYYLAIERSMVMPQDTNQIFIRYKIKEANISVSLTCKCHLECRSIHDQVKARDDEALRDWLEQACQLTNSVNELLFSPREGLTVILAAKNGEFILQPHWVYDQEFPLDAQWGLDHKGDAFAPGVFNFKLYKGDSGVLSIFAQHDETTDKLIPESESAFTGSIHAAETSEHAWVKQMMSRIPAERARNDGIMKMLVRAMDQFIIRLEDRWLIQAGYPWLGARVRDILECVGGLLAVGRDEVVRSIILQAAATEHQGMLADWLEGFSTTRTATESSLRLFTAIHDYIQFTGEHSFWDIGIKCMDDTERSLREILVSIFEAFRQGSVNGTGKYEAMPILDESSGMLYNPAAFSWMNTRHPCATPRSGYPVEIQALWLKALQVLEEIYPPYAAQARQIQEQISDNFISLYWSDRRGYLADVLLANQYTRAGKAMADGALRFNQLAAINVNLVPLEHARQIVDIINRRLLIPGGVRSLAEDPLLVPLKIVDDNGKLLADPRMPYCGTCNGDETSRRVAYHNGTAWPSAYPSFIEARAFVYRFTDLALQQALGFFEPVWTQFRINGIGTISEMKDGNFPHLSRGCFAYAPAVAESIRVYLKLKYKHNRSNARNHYKYRKEQLVNAEPTA